MAVVLGAAVVYGVFVAVNGVRGACARWRRALVWTDAHAAGLSARRDWRSPSSSGFVEVRDTGRDGHVESAGKESLTVHCVRSAASRHARVSGPRFSGRPP